MLSSSLASDKEQNRRFLLKNCSGLRFLAWQGCAIRGNLGEANLMQLMKVMSEEDSTVSLKCNIHICHDYIFQCFSRVFDQFQEWLERKREKYLCSDSQKSE